MKVRVRNANPKPCSECSYVAPCTADLTKHVRAVHTKERPFACTHCGKTFADKSNCTAHIRAHDGTDSFMCRVPGCGKAYPHRASWKAHEAKHFGTLFSCSLCKKTFANGPNVSRHVRNKHRGEDAKVVVHGPGAGHGSLAALAVQAAQVLAAGVK